ncbi:hypothetical protein BTVI_72484 [Pitangus sulphuratus]|nr:hypothetical protein BTVI_72484 [Pitangus sulphuratus]
MVLPGASGKKYLGRLKDGPWGSGVGVTKDLRPVTPQLKKRSWQQAFDQIKQEIAHAVALGPVRTGPEVKNVLYSATRENGPSWNLWQKVPRLIIWIWSRGYRGSEANYTPTEKEILAAYEGVQAASEVIGMEAQLLLAP